MVDAVDDKIPCTSESTDGLGKKGDVGQHTVVSGSNGVNLHHVKSIGVKVNSDLLSGDGLGMVVRLHVRVVGRGNGSKTGGVLVQQRGVVNRGTTVEGSGKLSGGTGVVPGVKISSGSVDEPGSGSVGAGVAGAVPEGEHNGLDRVGVTDVVLGGSTNRETGDGGGLELLNTDITSGLSHKNTLLVGDDGVVGPDTGSGEGKGGRGTVTGGKDSRNLLDLSGVSVPRRDKTGSGAHDEVNAHVVVGKGGCGKGDSRLPGEEERKGKVELVGDTSVKSVKEDVVLSVGGKSLNTVSGHGLVTSLLGGRDRKGGPEIKLGGLDLHRDKVVESDGNLLDKVVHEVLDPEVLETRNGGHDGGSDLKPARQKVVSSTRDGDRPSVSEISISTGRGKDDGDLGEPGRLNVLTNKVSDSFITSVKVILERIKGSKIDESRCDVRRIGSHVVLL